MTIFLRTPSRARAQAPWRSAILAVAACSLLTACQTDDVGPKTAAGAGLGAAIGGLSCAALGGNAGACLAAAGVGAVVGASIGAQLDARDRELREAALQQARVSATPTHWNNPKSGNSGTITPLRGIVQEGRQCQVVKETMVVKGDLVTEETTVCP